MIPDDCKPCPDGGYCPGEQACGCHGESMRAMHAQLAEAKAQADHVPTLQAEVERLRAYRDAETVRCAKADCYDRICQHLGVTSNVIGTIAERERRVKEQAVAEWLEKKSSGLGFVDMDRDEVLAEIAALRLGGAI